ncbi:IMPACT family protein, partial [Lactobacillus nasalidis]
AGTAGVPELRTLQLMQLKNVAVVVTRYFGGIKLGAGGLIRAYSGSVSEAAKAIGVVKRVLQQELIFTIPYNRYDKVDHFLKEREIYVAGTEYGVSITISVYLDLEQVASFIADLTELLNGEPDLIKGDQRYNEIPVKEIGPREKND